MFVNDVELHCRQDRFDTEGIQVMATAQVADDGRLAGSDPSVIWCGHRMKAGRALGR
jgi:hypothetical protein